MVDKQQVGIPDKLYNKILAHRDGVYVFSAREDCDESVTQLIEENQRLLRELDSAQRERESTEVAATPEDCKGAAVKVIRKIVPDDGKEGSFYRDGHAWVRNRDGTEHRNIDIAPNCHRKWLMEKALCDELIAGLCYNEIEGGES